MSVRKRRIMAAYWAALGGRHPLDVRGIDLLPEIRKAVPGPYISEQEFGEAVFDELSRFYYSYYGKGGSNVGT
jgi:hypothetical protein